MSGGRLRCNSSPMKNRLSVLAAFSLLALFGVAPAAVKVVYAGSLVTPMERTVGPAFAVACGCPYEGEGKGSVALSKLIEGGARNPDIFISADSQLMDGLLHPAGHPPFISEYTVFGAAHLVVGYSSKSAYRAQFEEVAAGKLPLARLLASPGLRIGRTDPTLDPKGKRTISALHGMGLGVNVGEAFPEEDLLVRLESGDLDAAFLYSTESRSRDIPAVDLPPTATYDPVTYSIAILSGAGNQQGARTFRDYILGGPGRAILERAGLSYMKPVLVQK